MSLTRIAAVVQAAAAFVFASTVSAQTAPAAAQMCGACHGAQGIATAPDAPNLAGQSAIYVSAQLKAYRSGTRKHEVMNVVAKPLSDADIDALSAWYSSIKIEVRTP